MSSRLTPAPRFADGQWPDERALESQPFALRDIDRLALDPQGFEPDDPEPPLHPSELDQLERPRWSIDRLVPLVFVRFMVFFFVGVGTTLAWQAYGSPARRMAANWSPWLGWLAPPVATAVPPPSAPVSAAAGGVSASPGQLTAISHSLAAVRHSVDKLAVDVGRLEAAKRLPPVRTSNPPLPPVQPRRSAVQRTSSSR